ncbi:MAG: YncE family protein [Pseudomonadota bacterium]|nr:YncE family protein [Pseudomonadota bacterium]
MNYSTVRYILALLILHLPLLANAETTETRYLLALSKAEHTLSFVDLETYQVTQTVPVGPNPHEIALSDDGQFAYVSNPGNNNLHEISVVDLIHRKALKPIDTSPLLSPHGLVYQNNKLWFTAQGSKALGRIDIKTNTLEWVMGTGQDFTHLLEVSNDGKSVFATNAKSGTVSIFDEELHQPQIPPSGKLPPTAQPYIDWNHTLIQVEKGSEGFDLSPDKTELWTVSSNGVLSIIDTQTKKRIQHFQTHIPGAHRLKFIAKQKQVVVVSVKTGEVVYFSAKTKEEVKRLKAPQGDTILVDETKNLIFISCPMDNVIAVINNSTFEIVDYIKIGGRPDGLAIVSLPDSSS